MTLFSDRDERVIENLRIINSRFIRKKKVVPRGERPSPFGKGGGAPTVVVAAADSTQYSKDRADFHCLGFNDQVIIQAALDVCALTGGLVWLCEGVYYCEIPTTGPAITVPPTVTLCGIGPGYDTSGTALEMSNVSDPGRQPLIELDHHTELRNLTVYTFDSALPVRLQTERDIFKITDCWLESRDAACLEGEGNRYLWLERNIMFASGDFATDADSVVHLTGSTSNFWITRNLFESGWHGVFIDGPQGRNFIHDNHFIGNYFSNLRLKSDALPIFASTVTGNMMQAPGQGALGTEGDACIYVSGDSGDIDPLTTQSNGVIISNNTLEPAAAVHGIRLTGIALALVHDNYIETPGLHGIYLEDTNACTVFHNTIHEPAGFPDGTIDGIHLVTSDQNYILGNTVIETGGGSPSVWRYGINISDAASDDNAVLFNDLRLAGSGTDFFNNAGTGTIIDPPAGAPYGSNLT